MVLNQNNTKVDGATITGNQTTNPDGLGGGIYIKPKNDISIISATIQSNTASLGGGIYADQDAGIVLGPNKTIVISDNSSTNLYLTKGTRLTTTNAIASDSRIYVYLEDPVKYNMVTNTPVGIGNAVHASNVYADTSMTGYILTEDANVYGGQLYATLGSYTEMVTNVYNDQPLTSGLFQFATAEGSPSDRSAVYYYSDGYFMKGSEFSGEADDYDEHLATMSMCMAMSAFGANAGGTDYSNKSAYVQALFAGIGMNDIYVNKYFQTEPETDSMGVAIAHKTLPDGTILMPIALRGANYQSEWASNVTIGDNGEHKGFSDSATIVMDEINSYLNRYHLDGSKVKFWIAGYSRAGAVTNLTAKRLVDTYNSDGKRVFAYCFEAPQGGTAEEEQRTGNTYENIKCMINANDVVPLVAPSAMGFKRYGEEHRLFTGNIGDTTYNGLKSQMLTQLGAVNNSIVFDDRFEAAEIKYVGGTLSGVFSGFQDFADEYLVYILGMNYCSKTLTWALNEMLGSDFLVKAESKYYSNLEEYNKKMVEVFEYYALDYKKTDGATDARDFYTNSNPTYYEDSEVETFQESLRELIVFMQTLSDDTMAKYSRAVINAFSNLPKMNGDISMRSLYLSVVGGLSEGWTEFFYAGSSPTDTSRDRYVRTSIVDGLVDLLANYKSGPGSNLTEEQCKTLKKALPSVLWRLFYFVAGDYKDYDQNIIGTLASNATAIMQAHYPEVNLAWLRSSDSFYQNTQGIVPAAEVEDVKPTVPVASINPGTYSKELNVELSTTPSDSLIYYTVDGSDPKFSDTKKLYVGSPITLAVDATDNKTYTINAYAMRGALNSSTMTYEYKILSKRYTTTTSTNMDDVTSKQQAGVNSLVTITSTGVKDKTWVTFSHWELTDESGKDVTSDLLGDTKIGQQSTSFTMPAYNVNAKAVYQYMITGLNLQVGEPNTSDRPASAEWCMTTGMGMDTKYYCSSGYVDADTTKKYVRSDLTPISISWGSLDSENRFLMTAIIDPNQDLIPLEEGYNKNINKPFLFDQKKVNQTISVNYKYADRVLESERLQISYLFDTTLQSYEEPTITVKPGTTNDELQALLPKIMKFTTNRGDLHYSLDTWNLDAVDTNTVTTDTPYVATTAVNSTSVKYADGLNTTIKANINVVADTVAMPVAGVRSGTYCEEKSVTLSAEEGTTIYYTTDDTVTADDPAGTWTQYTEAVSITDKQKVVNLRAVAVKSVEGSEPIISAVASYSYDMNIRRMVTVDCYNIDPYYNCSIQTNEYDFRSGTEATIKAPVIENMKFKSWNFDGNTTFDGLESTASTITFTMPDNNVTLTANYIPYVKKIEADVSYDKQAPNAQYFQQRTVNKVIVTYFDDKEVDMTDVFTAFAFTFGDSLEWNKEYEFFTGYFDGSDMNDAPFECNSDTVAIVNGETIPSESIVFNNDSHFNALYTIVAIVPKITSIIPPDDIYNIDNGTPAEDIDLPKVVKITAEDGNTYYADVTWDAIGEDLYDPSLLSEQTFTVHGNITLPEGVSDTDPAFNKGVDVIVTVNAIEPVANPISSIASGTYKTSLKVGLMSATRGATINYTLDGTEPTEQSALYEGEITLDVGTDKANEYEIKAIAVLDGYPSSEVKTFTYELVEDGKTPDDKKDDTYKVPNTADRSYHLIP